MNVCGTPGGVQRRVQARCRRARGRTRYFSAPGFSVGVRGSDPGAAGGGGAPRAWPGAVAVDAGQVRLAVGGPRRGLLMASGIDAVRLRRPASCRRRSPSPCLRQRAVHAGDRQRVGRRRLRRHLQRRRAASRARSVGSIVVVRGFSTAHVSVVDSPGLIELGSALNSMMRAGSVPAS